MSGRVMSGFETLLARARGLAAAGRHDEAKAAYLEVLRQDPAHGPGLSELAALAHENDNRDAARTLYKHMVQCHPGNATGWINLGTILFEDGELFAARGALEAALRIDDASQEAHRSLAQVLAALDETDEAESHWRRSFPRQGIAEQRYRGKEPATRVLLLVSVKGGNIPAKHIFDGRTYKVTVLYVEYYKPALPLPPHALIFNAVGDADLCHEALTIAERIVARSDAPVINPPAQVLKTGRVENAARMGALAHVRAPRTTLRRKSELDDLSFPLLLRAPGFHTGQHFVKVEQREDVVRALAELPGDEVLAIEYLEARGGDGKARKYRVMFIGGALYPLHLAVSSDWKVHYFTADMGVEEAHRREERHFLEHMDEALGAKAVGALARIAGALGLEYGGIDFAVGAGGELLFFEANATMVIVPPPADPKWDYRRAAIARALDAAKALPLARIRAPMAMCG
jgi:glutathione synthase/RimK-type ligase-like ATP-grasp enzyme